MKTILLILFCAFSLQAQGWIEEDFIQQGRYISDSTRIEIANRLIIITGDSLCKHEWVESHRLRIFVIHYIAEDQYYRICSKCLRKEKVTEKKVEYKTYIPSEYELLNNKIKEKNK